MPKPKKCPRRHRCPRHHKASDLNLCEQIMRPVTSEMPRNTSYSFKEVELIPHEDGTYTIPPLNYCVNLAESYYTLTPL